MRRLLAGLFNGSLSRRDFARHMMGLGFGTATVESILDTVPAGAGAHSRFRAEPFSERTPYEQWMAAEGVPIHTGYHVPDVRALALKPWERLGAKGALIDLEGAEGTDGAYVFELAPGASTSPQRYLFEESLYVLDGEGETAVWHEGSQKEIFRWARRTLFSPPLNTWRQHTNRGTAPARLIAFTDLPLVMDLFHSAEFIFDNDFAFRDRYDREPGYFTVNASKMKIAGSAATFGEGEKGAVGVLDTGLVPDVNGIELFEARARGLKNKSAEIVLSDNSMQSHLSEFEVGTYKRAHRHGPGSHVLALGGVGYSLMWTSVPRYSEAPKQVRVDWKDGTLFVPPDRWFHQHFNAGETAAKYMATTWIGGKYFVKGMGGGGRTHRLNTISTHHGGNMVDYPDEDPAIRSIFEEELRKNGVAVRMPPRK
jgi:hypothetical protein